MQTSNVNVAITVTGRHKDITAEMREYAQQKIEGLHLDYPKIIEAKAILDISNYRQLCEIILFCANHITIEATSEHENMMASIDETISKIARRMRKHKTRLLKSHRPRKHETIRAVAEAVYHQAVLESSEAEAAEAAPADPVPHIVHKEHYRLKPLYVEEAIMDLELSERSFVLFKNAETGRLCLLHQRADKDYGLIDAGEES
ncbi:MAG: ribosome-associated translation inhibitor RaiA [Verrucomicrobiota bacterium]